MTQPTFDTEESKLFVRLHYTMGMDWLGSNATAIEMRKWLKRAGENTVYLRTKDDLADAAVSVAHRLLAKGETC